MSDVQWELFMPSKLKSPTNFFLFHFLCNVYTAEVSVKNLWMFVYLCWLALLLSQPKIKDLSCWHKLIDNLYMKSDSYNLEAKTYLICMEACFLSKQDTRLKNFGVFFVFFVRGIVGWDCVDILIPSVPLANWVVPKGAI